MSIFNDVGAAKVRRSKFNLSYEKLFTCDMGQLIPVLHEEVLPGDIWNVGNEIVVRMMPLVAPVLHEINVFVHYFFVPYRLLWDDWEDFITGGEDGTNSDTLPTWQVTGAGDDNAVGSLWDYFGFPTGIVPADAYPIDFPKRAYNFIYNEYYRDQNIITAIDIETSESVLQRAWGKDYFTTSLPWQQRGTTPALSISGTLNIDASGAVGATSGYAAVGIDAATDTLMGTSDGSENTNLTNALEKQTVDLSGATTFDIADLREAFQIQVWMERNARCGARYPEFLRAHFKVSPSDARLQRPEFIGASRTPLIISEVLQTSETNTTVQGTMAGHGITADKNGICHYRAEEFGVIMGIMSIMPKSLYQQGIDRQWLRETRYDFPFPEFANLSEQEVLRAEIYASNTGSENTTVFGYQGRYNECRHKKNMVCGLMRTSLDYWHFSRQFGSAPTLNQTFIECDPRKDPFAASSEPGFLVSFGNIMSAVRPIPYEARPGMIDH